MKVIKRLSIHVFLPLIFAFIILFMLVAVPINASQYTDMEIEKVELQKAEDIEKTKADQPIDETELDTGTEKK